MLGGEALKLVGTAAIPSAKLAYARFVEIRGSARWRALAAHGARPQRLLWASTATKSPAYSDVLYVESLIGPDTVVTIPPDTLRRFQDHGTVVDALSGSEPADARRALDMLAGVGIDVEDVHRRLEEQGIGTFVHSYEKVLAVIAAKRGARRSAAERLPLVALGRWEGEGGDPGRRDAGGPSAGTRTEHDALGSIEVSSEHLWGAQTQRSLEHFRISGERMPRELILALALAKRACTSVNRDLGLLDTDKANAIIAAVDGAGLLVRHPPHGAEPGRQRGPGVLEDRAGRHRRLAATGGTLKEPPHDRRLGAATLRAAEALGPPQLHQVGATRFRAREALLEFGQIPGIILHAAVRYGLGSA